MYLNLLAERQTVQTLIRRFAASDQGLQCMSKPVCPKPWGKCGICIFSDHYVTLVNWLTTEKVLVKWLNRAQNLSIITICSTVTAKCREVSVYID